MCNRYIGLARWSILLDKNLFDQSSVFSLCKWRRMRLNGLQVQEKKTEFKHLAALISVWIMKFRRFPVWSALRNVFASPFFNFCFLCCQSIEQPFSFNFSPLWLSTEYSHAEMNFFPLFILLFFFGPIVPVGWRLSSASRSIYVIRHSSGNNPHLEGLPVLFLHFNIYSHRLRIFYLLPFRNKKKKPIAVRY